MRRKKDKNPLRGGKDALLFRKKGKLLGGVIYIGGRGGNVF